MRASAEKIPQIENIVEEVDIAECDDYVVKLEDNYESNKSTKSDKPRRLTIRTRARSTSWLQPATRPDYLTYISPQTVIKKDVGFLCFLSSLFLHWIMEALYLSDVCKRIIPFDIVTYICIISSGFYIVHDNIHMGLFTFYFRNANVMFALFMLWFKTVLNCTLGYTLAQGNSVWSSIIIAIVYTGFLFTDSIAYKPRAFDRLFSVILILWTGGVFYQTNRRLDDSDNPILFSDYTLLDFSLAVYSVIFVLLLQIVRGSFLWDEKWCYVCVSHAEMHVRKHVDSTHRIWIPAVLVFAYLVGFFANNGSFARTEPWDTIFAIYLITVFCLIMLSLYPFFIYKNVNMKLIPLIFDRNDTIWLMCVPVIIFFAIDIRFPEGVTTYLNGALLNIVVWVYLGLDTLEKRQNWIILGASIMAILICFAHISFGLNDPDRNEIVSEDLDDRITKGRVRRTLFTSFFILAIRSLGVAIYNLKTGKHLLLFIRARGFRPKIIIGEPPTTKREIGGENINIEEEEPRLSFLFFQEIGDFSPNIGLANSRGSVMMTDIENAWNSNVWNSSKFLEEMDELSM